MATTHTVVVPKGYDWSQIKSYASTHGIPNTAMLQILTVSSIPYDASYDTSYVGSTATELAWVWTQ